jgi:hypothetical protein
VYAAAIAAVLVSAAAVSAQDTLDSSEPSNYGSLDFTGGLFVDPYILTMISGGDIDAASAGLPSAEGCVGFVTSAPDFQFDWDGSGPVRIFFAAEGDTTLIVEAPDGTVRCNDDGGGYPLSPVLDLDGEQTGTYSVWVGTYQQAGSFIEGYLFLTQGDFLPGAVNLPFLGSVAGEGRPLAPVSGADVGSTGGAAAADGGPAVSADGAAFGSSALAPGFAPVVVEVTSGDELDAFGAALGPSCRGYIREGQADYTVEWDGGGSLLRIFFVDEAAGDGTLVVQLPDGTYTCGDDFGGGNLNPMIDVLSPAAGTYNIWVGNFASGQPLTGSLYITEALTFTPNNVP